MYMKVYEKPNAVLVSFESEHIMDLNEDSEISSGFSYVSEGVFDLGDL